MSNVQKFREPIMAPDFLRIDGTAVGGGGASATGTPTTTDANVTATETAAAVQRLRFTFAVTDGDWLNATDTASHNMGTLGRRGMILGTVGSLLLTKKGSLLTTTDIDLGVGVQENTDSVMSADEDIIVEKIDFNDDTLSLQMDWSTGCQTNGEGTYVAEASTPLWLNMYANVGADSTYDLTGYIDIFFVDLGAA